MGIRDAGNVKVLDEAIALAERVMEDADKGRVDLADLGRRARRVLESTAKPGDDERLL
jgi:hypothetical protein